jgi:2',3'-cyclic-nucleotide 2'-phosphodiesterase (5'-nucleotidase family)
LRLTILHTNDVHGAVDGLARVATLVERIRAEEAHPVVYLDAGDVEETTTRISNITKGTAMHRLLGAAGCQAATVGNAAWLRYGAQVLPEHAAAAPYPLLLANLRPADGVRESVVVEAGGLRVGVIGVTAPYETFLVDFAFGLESLDVVPLVRGLARSLRADGAELVVVLSHLGLDTPQEAIDDRRLASALAGEIDLIVGAHSHDLLPDGEWVDGVLVAQAGSHGAHLGRIDVVDGELRARVVEVPEDTPLHPAVIAAADAIEPEVEAVLAAVIGELPEALDPEAAAGWLAEILRVRMTAEVALVTTGQAFTGGLPGGALRRGALWDVCDSSANPGVTTMTGAQLRTVIERGRDPEFERSTAGPLRGRARGPLQVSGPAEPDPARVYTVAGTDWELEPYGGMVDAEWGLVVRYDFPTIVREAIEEHLGAEGTRRRAAPARRAARS